MKPVDEWEHDEVGCVFAFSPERPLDPEYRQAYQEAQLKWLERWEPYEGDWIQ